LQALGYKPPEAQRMLEKVATDGATTEDLIRAALQGTTLKQERA
jgi:Holliday junction resolvasome RuvABC DNA-binding subunit